MWILWLIVGIVFSIAEILYNGFFLIWFALAAFITIFVSLFTDNTLIQSIVFIVIALVLLLTQTKRFTEKFGGGKTIPTNIDSLIGKKGIVTEKIGEDNLESGLVKLEGEIWSAISANGKAIEKGNTVEIEAIKGVRLIVNQIEI